MLVLSIQCVHLECAGDVDVAGVLVLVPAKPHSRRESASGSVLGSLGRSSALGEAVEEWMRMSTKWRVWEVRTRVEVFSEAGLSWWGLVGGFPVRCARAWWRARCCVRGIRQRGKNAGESFRIVWSVAGIDDLYLAACGVADW